MEEPIPIVGTFKDLVIFFAKEDSTHSKTIENTPFDSRSFASLKIFFLSDSCLSFKFEFSYNTLR